MARSDVFLCELCPKSCRIREGYGGDCKSRIVVDGELRAVTYGRPCSLHIDPIEKKPLFHFLPGTPILSLATAGCNLHCKFCQNWTISQAAPEDIRSIDLPPHKVVDLAMAQRYESIVYTYTEPVIFLEYVLDTAAAARERNLLNVTVTAGYINPKPMELLCRVTDEGEDLFDSATNSFLTAALPAMANAAQETIAASLDRRTFLALMSVLSLGCLCAFRDAGSDGLAYRPAMFCRRLDWDGDA